MINKDDFISGVRNVKTDDLKFKSVLNNKTIINNGYFLYENIRYYMFSKRITISQKTQENSDIGFDFPIVKGYRKSIGSNYSFNNPIFCISSLDKILTTDTQQEYININDIVNIDFSVDYDGKEYFIVFNQDYNEEFHIIFNQGETVNINLSNVYNDKFILGEKSNILSNLSIECTTDDRKNNIFSFLSTLTNNQNVPIANKDIAFYKISTIYDERLLNVKIDVERLYENKEFQKISPNTLYIPEDIGVDITNLTEHDVVVSDNYLPINTEIIHIDVTNRIITLSNDLDEDTPTDVSIQLIYRNIYKSFFDKLISSDGTYWTGYQMITSTVTDELGNATSDIFKINTYEDKIFIFSALEDKSLQSELYWIDLSSVYISNRGNSFLDDMHYKLAAQEALTAMGVDIWNEFWSEDVDASINVEERTANTDWYENRRNWRNSHYFLERAPINYSITEDGDGTLENPYKILSYSDLETKINGESQTDKHYILLNDIEVKITEDIDILSSFSGTLDGQGYTINILNIDETENQDESKRNNVGLFRKLDNAKINNLIIKVNTNGSVKGVNNVGILAGLVTGNTIITRVSCYGKVKGQNYIGGIIGKCEGSLNISFSSFNGEVINENINDENTYVGGIIGYINYYANSEYSKITNIHTEGQIFTDSTAIVNNYIFAGGICGYINYNTIFSNVNRIGRYLISSMNIEDVSNNSKTIAASIFGFIDPAMSYFDNVISLANNFTNVYSDNNYQSNKLIGTYNNTIVNTYFGCSLNTTTINGIIPETSQPNGVYHDIVFFRNLDNYNKTANNLSFNIKYIWKSTSKNNFYNGFPIFTWQQDILDEYQDGTAEYPWHINNVNDLDNLRRVVNNGEQINNWTDNAYYIMTQDIYPSLLSSNWVPIGTVTNPFKGHFDGGDHEIINLQYNGNHDKPIGLFGCISGAEIHNLTVMANISHTKNYTGSIAGIAKNHSLIQNCYVSSTFDINSDLEIEDEATGLICGYLEDSNIINCIDNDGVILNINNNRDIRKNVGGICGKIGKVLEDENNEYNHIENCKIDCKIQGLYTNVGGVVGYCDADNAVIQNNNCIASIYWIDSITSNYTINMTKFVGGICGYIENAYKISVNLFRGKNIEGLNNHLCASNYLGGICGKINNEVIFENNETIANLYIDFTNTNLILDNIYLGGIVGYNKLTNITKCIFNGNIGCANNIISNKDIFLCGITYYINAGITKCYSIINNYNFNDPTKGYRIGISENANYPNLDNNYAKAVGYSYLDNAPAGVDSIRSQCGLTLTVETLEDQNTYIGYDFDEIWMMSDTYPILQISTLHTVINFTATEASYVSETKHTTTSEPLGRWNFNDYYNKYLKDTSILLSSAREHIGNYMSCAYQGYLGHIKLTGQDILDMTKKGPDGYLEKEEYRQIQEQYGTKDTLEDVILNAEDNFYTIAYNLVPRTEYKNWLENFKNTYDISSNNEGDYYMLDFDRRLGTVFESPFPYKKNTPEYLKPNSVVTTDFGDYGYDYSKVNGSDTSEADLDWLRRISKVEHIDPRGSFNKLLYKLNTETDVVHYDIYFSEGKKPPTWQKLTYVFYIPSIIYYDSDHELKPDVFFDIILNSGCYFRGLAVMYAFCSKIIGLEIYNDTVEGNLQYPYEPYYSNFTLGSLIDEYIYTNKSTQESINLKHYKL